MTTRIDKKNAVPAAAFKSELQKVIRREARGADGAEGPRNGKIELSELGYMQGFLRAGATGKSVAAVEKAAVKRADKELSPALKDGAFDKADLASLKQKNALLGELAERAFRSVQRSAALPEMKTLPSAHPVSKVVRSTADDWSSSNLMAASIAVGSGKFAGPVSAQQLQGVAKELFIRALEENDGTFASSAPKVDAHSSAAGLDLIASAVSKDGLMSVGAEAQVKRQVSAISSALGTPLEVFTAQKRLFVDDAGEKRNTTLALAVNTRTGEYASFYVRQGNL